LQVLVPFAIVLIFSFLFALLGLGSASVVIPIIYWFTGDLHSAIVVGLLVNVASSSITTASFARSGKISLHRMLPLLVGAFLMPPAGAYVSHIIPHNTVLLIFSIFLIFSGANMLVFAKKKGRRNCARWQRESLIYLATGLLGGFLAGMLGIGGGSVVLPLLALIGFDVKKSGPNIAPMVLLSSIMGIVSHLAMDSGLSYNLFIPAIAAAFTGAFAATRVHSNLKESSAKAIAGIIFLLLALKILYHLT